MVTDHGHEASLMSRMIKASEFKAKCLALLDEVERTGNVLVVTKRGKAIAEVRPHQPAAKRSPFGIWKGKTEILGDIISPIDVAWEALK